MPINPRPITLQDVIVRLFDQGSTPTIPSAGQVVHAVLLTRGGVTTLGQTYATPSVARGATWIAVGDGTGTPGVGDTALFHETARSPVLPFYSLPGQTIANALLSAVHGNGVIREMGLYGPGGGGTPSLTPGSGTLYTHANLEKPFIKNTSKFVTCEWVEG